MLLLLDDGLPASLAVELLRRGRDARTVREAGLETATDGELFARAAGAVIVTTDDRLPAVRPAGATVAVVGGTDLAARREAVHRWAHAIASQRPGSARRYGASGHRAWVGAV